MKPNENYPDNISFTSIEYRKKAKEIPNSKSLTNDIQIKSTTQFFRPDLNWQGYSQYILDNYPEGVPIYIYGCSDGTEAYSLRLILDKKQDKDTRNLYPIEAIEIDLELVAACNERTIGIYNYLAKNERVPVDEMQIKENIDEHYSKYFTKIDDRKPYVITCPVSGPNAEYVFHKVDEKLYKSINFRQGDITKEIAEKEYKEPCIIMFRNAWIYLKEEEIVRLFSLLEEKLPKNSLIVLGYSEQYDQRLLSFSDKTGKKKPMRLISAFSNSDKFVSVEQMCGKESYNSDPIMFMKKV
jgi:chemotaxis methyl-accepting protein methylase